MRQTVFDSGACVLHDDDADDRSLCIARRDSILSVLNKSIMVAECAIFSKRTRTNRTEATHVALRTTSRLVSSEKSTVTFTSTYPDNMKIMIDFNLFFDYFFSMQNQQLINFCAAVRGFCANNDDAATFISSTNSILKETHTLCPCHSVSPREDCAATQIRCCGKI